MIVFILDFMGEENLELDSITDQGLFRSSFLWDYYDGIDEVRDWDKKIYIRMPDTVSSDDFNCLKRWMGMKGVRDELWWNTLSDEQKKRMLSAAIELEMPEKLIEFIRKQLE